jgi:hypothetical protein
VHKAVLAILAAASFEQLLQTVTTDLGVLLDVDVVTIGVESTAAPAGRLSLHGIHLLKAGAVDALLGPERPTLLRTDAPGEAVLFGGAAGLVRSQALLRTLAALDDLLAWHDERRADAVRVLPPGSGERVSCALMHRLAGAGVPVLVDPSRTGALQHYRGATLAFLQRYPTLDAAEGALVEQLTAFLRTLPRFPGPGVAARRIHARPSQRIPCRSAVGGPDRTK